MGVSENCGKISYISGRKDEREVWKKKITDKIKELEEKKNKLSNSIEFYEENTQFKYHNLIIKIDILKDLLKEN